METGMRRVEGRRWRQIEEEDETTEEGDSDGK